MALRLAVIGSDQKENMLNVLYFIFFFRSTHLYQYSETLVSTYILLILDTWIIASNSLLFLISYLIHFFFSFFFFSLHLMRFKFNEKKSMLLVDMCNLHPPKKVS